MRTTGLGRAVCADGPTELGEESVARAIDSSVPYESPSGVLIGTAAGLVTASA